MIMICQLFNHLFNLKIVANNFTIDLLNHNLPLIKIYFNLNYSTKYYR